MYGRSTSSTQFLPPSPDTMSVCVWPAPMLLLLLWPLVECLGSPQLPPHWEGSWQNWLGREAQPSLRPISRTPKDGGGELTAVIDVSHDDDQLPDTAGEYTSASLTKPGLPSDFTVCGAYRPKAWTGYTQAALFEIHGEDGTLWGLVDLQSLDNSVQILVIFGNVFIYAPPQDNLWFPLTWIRVCVSLDTVSGRVRLVVDGQVLHESQQDTSMFNGNRPTNLSIRVGAIYVEYTGQYSNLNVFIGPLSIERMVAMTQAGSGECGAQGDFLSWEEADWNLHSQAREEMVGELEGPCRRKSSVDVFTLGLVVEHSQCMHHCQKIAKGRSPPVHTLKDLQTLRRELHLISNDLALLPYLYISATDKKKEGDWRDFYTGELLEDYAKPWSPGHDAVRGDQSNCLAFATDQAVNNSWFEHICVANYGCPCQYEQEPILNLRGLCEHNWVDTRYKPTQLTPKAIILQGNMHTKIEYNDSSSLWILTDARYKLTAVSRASKASYVLGKHQWTVTGDVLECNESYTTFLKMSGCSIGEFTCNDGQCVTMGQRCNQIANCRDKSDERGCMLLVLEEGYNDKVPPIVPTGGDEFNQTTVGISISLLKIVSMEEVQHKIDLQFEITLEWTENRANYHNLKGESSLNALTDEEISQLWLPYVVYANTDMKDAVQLGLDGVKTTIVITKEGNFTRSGVDILDETDIFKGKDNKLVMSQTYTKSFQCQYNLQKYPFDTQVNIN